MKGTIDEARIYTVFIIVFSLSREHCGTGERAIDGNHSPLFTGGRATLTCRLASFAKL